MSQRIVKYNPPAWASSLKVIPTSVAKLAMTPTPIHEWKPPGTPDDFQVLIKRDDMTGGILTGSKIRKLEFILSEAVENSCKHVITAGAVHSNHCRAASAGCVQLGLKPHLLLGSSETDASKLKYEGNMLVNKLVGADIHLIPEVTFDYDANVKPRMERLAKQILEETGEKSMLVPMGGSGVTGLWGYIQCFEEIRQQGIEFDDMVCSCGTGGTLAGLTIANYLCGSPYKVHGIDISLTKSCDVYDGINEKLEMLGVTGVDSHDIVTIHEEYVGLGYGISQPQELDYIAQTAAETGIIFDCTYAGKAAYGLSHLMQNKPEVFKGRRVMFLHSGGFPSLYCDAIKDSLLPHCTSGKVCVSPPL